MATKTKTVTSKNSTASRKRGAAATAAATTQSTTDLVLEPVTPVLIEIARITPSPLNYREHFDEQEMEELAADIALHNVISAVTVRTLSNGDYELVVGHRRWMAACRVGLTVMPAMIRTLTDEQALELIFSENIHRANAHPLDEARGIARMLTIHKTIEEIAARIVQKPSYVYARLRLLELIPEIAAIFMAGKLTLTEAFEIAGIDKDAQGEFFRDNLASWEQPNFRLGNVRNLVARFKYDLKQAPFDTEDASLLEDAGACTRCPFNSALLTSLFQDTEARASCANRGCYNTKCAASFSRRLDQATGGGPVVTVITRGTLPAYIKQAIEARTGDSPVEVVNSWDINMAEMPDAPDPEDFMFEDDDTGQPVLDQEEYDAAVAAYEQEKEEYHELCDNPETHRGLFIDGATVTPVPYTVRSNSRDSYNAQPERKQTAAEVQTAIKTKTATPEMIEAEIVRIHQREDRAKVLDTEKMATQIHQLYCAEVIKPEALAPATDADQLFLRLIIYERLNYKHRQTIDDTFFSAEQADETSWECLYRNLQSLTDDQIGLMIRLCAAQDTTCQNPRTASFTIMWAMALAIGLDTKPIEQQIADVASERIDRMESRIKDYNKALNKLKTARPLDLPETPPADGSVTAPTAPVEQQAA